MINFFKKLMLFRVLILLNYSKNLTMVQKVLKLKEKLDHDHDKYITRQEFNKLIGGNFTAKLQQANLATKVDIFCRKDRF